MPEGRPGRRRLSTRRVGALVLAFALLAGIAATAADVLAVKRHAQAGAAHLENLKARLADDNQASRTAPIRAAAAELSAAEARLDDPLLQGVARLPLIRTYLADARQLVQAARVLTGLAPQLSQLDSMLGGTSGFLFWPQQVDLQTLRASAALAARITGELDQARKPLLNMRWAPGSRALTDRRDAALQAIGRVERLTRVLARPKPLLDALGANGVRRYLVVLTDDTSSLPSGGRAVAAAVVEMRDGAVAVKSAPPVSAVATWSHQPDNHWLGAGPHDLVYALAPPIFPIAAREAISWYQARTGRQVDGAVRLTPSALARLYQALGSPARVGHPTAGTIADLVRFDSGPTVAGAAARARRILVGTLQQLVATNHAQARLDAMAASAQTGALAVFLRDPGLERYVSDHGLGGQFASDPHSDGGDLVGVFVSGASVPVRTTTRQQIAVRPRDLLVVRSTTVTLPSDGAAAEMLPVAAKDVALRVDGRLAGATMTFDPRRRLYAITLPAGKHLVRYTYVVPRPAGTSPVTEKVETPPDGLSQVVIDVAGSGVRTAGDSRWRSQGAHQVATVTVGGEHVLTLAKGAPYDVGFRTWFWHSGGRLALWLAVCLGLAWVGRRRVWVPAAAAALLYVLVPLAAESWLTGASRPGDELLLVHPATWLVLVTVVVMALTRPSQLRSALRDAGRTTLVLLAVVLVVAVMTSLRRHSGGWSQLVESLVAAPLLGVLVLAACRRHLRAFLVGAVTVGLGIAVLATVEGVLGRNVVYAAAYAARYAWGAPDLPRSQFRAATTLDQPLNTAFLLVALLPLVWHLVGRRWRVPAAALVLVGIAATVSRVSFVVAVGYLVIVLLRAVLGLRRRPASSQHATWLHWVWTAAIAVLAVVLAVGVASRTAHYLMARALNDGGSGSLRVRGLTTFLPHLRSHLFVGSGVGTSEHITRHWMQSANSAENPLVMLSVDLGVVAAVLLFVALFSFARLRAPHRWTPAQQALVTGLVAAFGYSSIATHSAAVPVVWILAALGAAQARAWREGGPDNRAIDELGEVHVEVVKQHELTAKPVVTAIMAARDAAPVIGEAVASVLHQTMTDFELIVVDDGSRDATAATAVAAAGNDPRVTVLRIPTGVGRGVARNLAVERSHGRYLAICDADDRSRPHRFADQRATLDRDPDVGVVAGQIAAFGDWGGPTPLLHYPTRQAAIEARFDRGHNPIPHAAAMLRRDLFDRVGGYAAECVRAQDLELLLRMRAHAHMANLPQVVLDYRQSRRPSLRYWIDNNRWRRFAVARAAAIARAQTVPQPHTLSRRAADMCVIPYDVASYARNRVVLARRGARSL